MTPLYNFGIRMYGLGIRLGSPFVKKARLWVQGRKNWKARLGKAIDPESPWIWFHCSSLGEFEQGRPVIEAWRTAFPEDKILLTFFSPSGYEIRKNYAQADHVAYLPLDTPGNARDFLEIVRPKVAFFVKYDLWLNFLAELRQRSIPHYLFSALLRPDSKFLRSSLKDHYAAAFNGFGRIFAQDEGTRKLLGPMVGEERIEVVGDTRFDRVAELPDRFVEVEGIAEFIGGRKCVVVGSSHGPDEQILWPTVKAMETKEVAWIVAPHEIEEGKISQWIAEWKGKMGRYSEREKMTGNEQVLVIDNVGMLGRLYHYADLAYVGGGFGKGIHNTQEPASYGNPVLFGPKYEGFVEAVDMVRMGSAAVVGNAAELEGKVREWLENDGLRESLREMNRTYIQDQAGATRHIMAYFSASAPA